MVETTNPTIVFDLDGTILDVSRRYYALYSQLLAEKGHVPLSEDEYWTRKQMDSPIPHTDSPGYVSKFRTHIEDEKLLALDTPFAGIHDVLTSLSLYITPYLVTLRHDREALLTQMTNLKLSIWFPQERILTPSLEKAGVIASIHPLPQAVVGDTKADVGAAHALGIASIGVISGLLSQTRMEELSPTFIATDSANLRAIIEQIYGKSDDRNPRV